MSIGPMSTGWSPPSDPGGQTDSGPEMWRLGWVSVTLSLRSRSKGSDGLRVVVPGTGKPVRRDGSGPVRSTARLAGPASRRIRGVFDSRVVHERSGRGPDQDRARPTGPVRPLVCTV